MKLFQKFFSSSKKEQGISATGSVVVENTNPELSRDAIAYESSTSTEAVQNASNTTTEELKIHEIWGD